MKKSLFQNVILTVTCLFLTSSLVAQSPQGIPYQAVMRNANGTVMASSAVSLTFMIHDGTANGTVVYQENHSLTSNAQGLVTCVVGNGVVSEGNFSAINWGIGAKFLHVMMGSTDLGTQQMMSVPYALYAENVRVRVSATGDTLVVGGLSVIVPGVSAANPPALYTQGIGVTDIDGNFYPSIIINGQEWMQKNLAVTKFRNGDPIPTGLDQVTWYATSNGAYSIYDSETAYIDLYGLLYNWYAVNDSRGVCPTGWHVPSDTDWTTLETNLGGSSVAGSKMKASSGWNSLYQGFPVSESSYENGFAGLPGGYSDEILMFGDAGYSAYWWSRTGYDPYNSWCRSLSSDLGRYPALKRSGYSVRCLKDSETPPIQGCTDGAACNFVANADQDDGTCLYLNSTCDDGDANTINDVIDGGCVCVGSAVVNGIYTQGNGVTDIDGKTYTSIIINGQEWMQQNLAVTKYGNGDLIPTGLSDAEWYSTINGAYAIYNNDEVNNILYGKLYNWYAVNDSRGLCPAGWHVPSDWEWSTLETNLGGSGNAGGKMKATTVWDSPNRGATNESGFFGLPGGSRDYLGPYTTIGIIGNWWSSTGFGQYSNKRLLYYDNSYFYHYTYWFNQDGYSVRCIRD